MVSAPPVRCRETVAPLADALGLLVIFFFKQKTAYEIVPCDWSSDVCSSDLYGDHSVWQRQWLEEGGRLEQQLAYWQQKLAGVQIGRASCRERVYGTV